MTKRKSADTTNTVNSTFSTSTSSSLTATPEAIELRLDLLPKDILTKIAEDTADHYALSELSTVSKFIRSTLFEMNPWSQLIKAHFPEAPVPTDANTAQYDYDGLIKTEYFYFTPFMISLFTEVKNNDLRRVTQLVSQPEFKLGMLTSYTDRHGRCLLSWVMLKNDPDMIDHFKNLLTQHFEHTDVSNLDMLISQAKILAHTELLSSIASHDIPEDLIKRVERNIQCGQEVNPTDLGQLNQSQCAKLLYHAARYRHIDYFQLLFQRLSSQPNNLLNRYIGDPFHYIYDAAKEHDQEFLQTNYEIFVSIIRLKNVNVEKNIHRLDYLCGRAALNIDFGYGSIVGGDDINQMTGEDFNTFINQQADFLADAIVLDDLNTIKKIMERTNCLINNSLSFKWFQTSYFAIYCEASYATFHYLINTTNFYPQKAEFTSVYEWFQDAVGSNLIPHALLLAHYTLSKGDSWVKRCLNDFYMDLMDNAKETLSISERAFLDGLKLLGYQPSESLNDTDSDTDSDSDNDSVQDTLDSYTP